MNKNKALPDWLRVVAQRALLGEATPNMRLICCSVSKDRLLIRFYFETEPTENDIEQIEIICGNMSSFGQESSITKIQDEWEVSKEPVGRLDTLDGVFFARYEAK